MPDRISLFGFVIGYIRKSPIIPIGISFLSGNFMIHWKDK